MAMKRMAHHKYERSHSTENSDIDATVTRHHVTESSAGLETGALGPRAAENACRKTTLTVTLRSKVIYSSL